MKTKCANGNTVENWYDGKTRCSVVQILDENGNQVADADYSGCRESAKFSKAQAIKNCGGKLKK